MTREEIIEQLDSIIGTYEILMGNGVNSDILDVDDIEAIREAISALSENKGEWIPFSEKLPDKYTKVLVSTYGIVTIGERTSDMNESLRLTILEPMNNMYKNIDPKQYQITHWQPLPKGYER